MRVHQIRVDFAVREQVKRYVLPPDFIVIKLTVTGHPARSSRLRKR